MAIEKGNTVVLEYTGTLEDGKVFDTSEGKQPLEFEAGSGKVIKGFDEAVIGMEKDEEKEFKIKPEQAYGEYRDELKRDIPRETLPKDQEPQTGMTLMLSAPNGQQFPATITEVKDNAVTIDLNHPLAGKELTFNIKIVDIK
ncbi:MAG: FKBP-type peptidyl-prolyl cis-trans isomerase [bacterium]